MPTVTFRCGTCQTHHDLPAEDTLVTVDSELLDPRFQAKCPARSCTTIVITPIEDDLADSLLRIGAVLAIR